MSEKEPEGEGPDEEALPEVPPVPTLPEAPALKPHLPPLPKEASKEETAAQYRSMGIAYTIPIALVAPIVLLTFIGAWLDRVYGQSYFTPGGAVLGIVVGFINMIRLVNRLNK